MRMRKYTSPCVSILHMRLHIQIRMRYLVLLARDYNVWALGKMSETSKKSFKMKKDVGMPLWQKLMV